VKSAYAVVSAPFKCVHTVCCTLSSLCKRALTFVIASFNKSAAEPWHTVLTACRSACALHICKIHIVSHTNMRCSARYVICNNSSISLSSVAVVNSYTCKLLPHVLQSDFVIAAVLALTLLSTVHKVNYYHQEQSTVLNNEHR
jgi:hypothetical protein